MREGRSFFVTCVVGALAGCDFTHGATATTDGSVVPTDVLIPDVSVDATVSPRVNQGLAALWRFDETSGTTIADDGPFNMPVTITVSTGFTWGGGKVTFDQPSRSNSSPNPPVNRHVGTTGAVTLEAWVSASAQQGGGMVGTLPNYAAIVTISPNIGVRNVSLLQVGDAWAARVRTSATTINGDPVLTAPANSVMLNQPTHLVVVASATERTFYVDGVPFMTTPVAAGSTAGWDRAYRIIFGDENAPYSRPWLGTFWLVAMYDRALTADEVRQNYDAGFDCDGC